MTPTTQNDVDHVVSFVFDWNNRQLRGETFIDFWPTSERNSNLLCYKNSKISEFVLVTWAGYKRPSIQHSFSWNVSGISVNNYFPSEKYTDEQNNATFSEPSETLVPKISHFFCFCQYISKRLHEHCKRTMQKLFLIVTFQINAKCQRIPS